MELNKNPLNELIGVAKKFGSLLLGPHILASHGDHEFDSNHRVPFEEPENGLWTSDGHQPSLWEGLPYYHD